MTDPHWQRLARILTHHLTLTTPLTLAEARRHLWHHLRIIAAGWHEWEAWHVVEAYEETIKCTSLKKEPSPSTSPASVPAESVDL